MLVQSEMMVISDTEYTCYFLGTRFVVTPPADDICRPAVAKKAGARSDHHLNIRSGSIIDPVAYRARLDRMTALSDIVKVSYWDFDWIGAEVGDWTQKAHCMIVKRARLILVWLGSDGATAFDAAGHAEMPEKGATLDNTFGAGDKFNAGVLSRIFNDGQLFADMFKKRSAQNLLHALTCGAYVGAITVSRAGASPPWVSDLDS